MRRILIAASMMGLALTLTVMTAPAQAQINNALRDTLPPSPGPKVDKVPVVPAAAPGVFSLQKHGANGLHLVLTGHTFTSRGAIEKYLAYRAAENTLEQQHDWFVLVESRTPTDKVPVAKGDPTLPRHSFRMEYFRPSWRYKIAGSSEWKVWSPFSGAAFFADGVDPKSITAFELAADLMLYNRPMASENPLAFDAGAVSDYLVNQVTPPA